MNAVEKVINIGGSVAVRPLRFYEVFHKTIDVLTCGPGTERAEMRLLRTEYNLDRVPSLWKRKSLGCPKNSDRVRIDCGEKLKLHEGSLSYWHQEVRKAGRKKTPDSSLKQLKIIRSKICVRPSHESLEKKLLALGYEGLHVRKCSS